MAVSKSNRIIILLVIDTAFFLLELSVGMLLPMSYGDDGMGALINGFVIR